MIEQLSRDATPTDKRAQARDSGIATMVGASGGQINHLKSPGADDSVIEERMAYCGKDRY